VKPATKVTGTMGPTTNAGKATNTGKAEAQATTGKAEAQAAQITGTEAM
jgi:hypothetical protein